jgi:pyruvate formate lyase activating enzyme
VPGTPAATLALARRIAKSAGLRHVYTGNVHDEAGQSTYCHACGTSVIGRNWFEITSWALDESGCCRSCGARCPGVFEEGSGSWGARRMPIELGRGERALG